MVPERYGLLYILTKMGFVYIYEIVSGGMVYKTRISHKAVLLATRNYTNDGLMAVDKAGVVYGMTIDDNALMPYLLENCGHINDHKKVLSDLAYRYSLPYPQLPHHNPIPTLHPDPCSFSEAHPSRSAQL